MEQERVIVTEAKTVFGEIKRIFTMRVCFVLLAIIFLGVLYYVVSTAMHTRDSIGADQNVKQGYLDAIQ